MLDELEKTKKCKDQRYQEALSSIKPTIKQQKNRFWWKSAYWAILLIITLSIIWHCRQKITAELSKTVVTLQKKAIWKKQHKHQPTPIIIAKAPPIRLQNVTLEQKDNRTILDFILSGATQYYVEHGTEQQLFITLSNTVLSENLPVSLEHTFIAALHTKQNNNTIVCSLTLLPGTKVDDLQLVNAPQPHLLLVFSNQQLTNTAMTKTVIPTSPEQQASEHYQEIQDLLTQNRVSEAISKLHMFIGEFPDNVEAREVLASLLIKDGQLQKANDILTVGLDKHHGYSPFIKLKGYILAKQNEPTAAIDLLQKYLASTDDIEYLALLASLYQQQGLFIQSADIYNQLTKIQPQKISWWLGLGLGLESAGKKNAAQEAYQHAYYSSDVPQDLRDFLSDRIKK